MPSTQTSPRISLSVWVGAFLGILLAALGTYIEVRTRGGSGVSAWIVAQAETPYLWMLNVLPLAFAAAAFGIGKRTRVPRGRTLGLIAAGLVVFSVSAFTYALDAERTTGAHLSDVNDSGSMRYRSLYIPALIREGKPWEDALAEFDDVLHGLTATYPVPGADVEAAWDTYARGLRETGTVDFQTTEALRTAADRLTAAIEAEGLVHSDRAVFGFVLGLLGMMVSLVMGILLLNRMSRMQRDLTKSERQFRETLANAPIGMAIVSLEGRFVTVNRALCEILGYGNDALLALDFQTITHPDSLQADVRNIEDLLSGHAARYQMEKRYIHASGKTVWAQLDVSLIRDGAGQPVHFISQIQDITETRTSQIQLQYLATHDSLTGLAKRDVLAESIQRAIDLRATTPSHSYAVLFIDLDSFKAVNDTYGHAIGDELLAALAKRIQASVRETDVAARVGGDEFAVLLNGMISEARAREMAERIQSSLASPFALTGELNLYAGASIGIALGDDRYQSYEDILHDADHAMYASKARGKGGVALHADRPTGDRRVQGERRTQGDRRAKKSAGSSTHMESELSHAIQNGELELRYQPIVRLADGALSGFEALVRWRHPIRGLLAPSVFIPLAEATGLIGPLGEWVAETAVQQALAWEREHEPLAVSINVSRHQMEDPGGVARLVQILSQTENARVMVELTEASGARDMDAVRESAQTLASAGARVFLDDFGTGYAFLNDVLGMPLAGLKVDRSLTQQVGSASGSEEVLGAVAEMAHRLGIESVAEGIEEPGQLDRVRALGCTHGQGYLFSRPVPAPEAASLIVSPPWTAAWDAHRAERLEATLASA